jgi:hypothetical protein
VGVAAGETHSLGLKADGFIIAWGENGSGQCDVPAPNADFSAIAAGATHSLGLQEDGTIVAWGDNAYGQCAVPAPNAGFVALSAGYHNSAGLKADGSIVAWGANYNQQLDVPAPNADFIAIGAGSDHSLAVRADGSLAVWGEAHGGTNDIPPPNTGFEAVTASELSCLGLRRPDGDTPVFLSALTIDTEPGAVTLRWEHAASDLPVAFRLEGGRGEQSWEVPYAAAGPGACIAIDRSPSVVAGGTLDYRLYGREGSEPWQLLRHESIQVQPASARTALLGAFPNPFNPQTSIRFRLAEAGRARLAIYDPAGRLVVLLADKQFAAGEQELIWTGRDQAGRALSSGVYLCRLETAGQAAARRLVLLR